MRVMSVVKVAFLAAAVALPSSITIASAKGMKPPPGACAVGKKWVANGTLCSYQCNPQTTVCAQQYCVNGALVQVWPCWGGFCSPKCPG
jgi:hypothetical protein